MKASIKARNVSKSFAIAQHGGGPVSLRQALRGGQREIVTRRIDALTDISFSVGMGERVGIIGRNGAGKTTLLSVLAGIAEPSSGEVTVKGDLHAMLSIGAVLREEATGRENIYLDGTIHGRTQAEMDALSPEIIAFSELGDFIDRPVRTYSSGMKARLAFSMGAFIDTDILIIDETLSVGDATFSRKAERRMREMTTDGKIVIVVSHSLSSITDICNRCLWLENGRLVMDGSPEAVTKAYLRAVDEADEMDLQRKFNQKQFLTRRLEAGAIDTFQLVQTDREQSATVRAFSPLSIVVKGDLKATSGPADLELCLTRVDGRTLWRQRASENGAHLPTAGAFGLSVDLDPFILGASLYRLEAVLSDAGGMIASIARVFEVVDEEGQFGGHPMLYHPMTITSRKLEGLEE